LGELLDCDAVVALPGGIGTLSELAVAWAASQTEADAPRLVAVGEGWRVLLETIARELIVDAADIALVRVAATASEAVDLAITPSSDRRPGARG
jgi:predicted Rossmann-fold nucleotide-binding protein